MVQSRRRKSSKICSSRRKSRRHKSRRKSSKLCRSRRKSRRKSIKQSKQRRKSSHFSRRKKSTLKHRYPNFFSKTSRVDPKNALAEAITYPDVSYLKSDERDWVNNVLADPTNIRIFKKALEMDSFLVKVGEDGYSYDIFLLFEEESEALLRLMYKNNTYLKKKRKYLTSKDVEILKDIYPKLQRVENFSTLSNEQREKLVAIQEGLLKAQTENKSSYDDTLIITAINKLRTSNWNWTSFDLDPYNKGILLHVLSYGEIYDTPYSVDPWILSLYPDEV